MKQNVIHLASEYLLNCNVERLPININALTYLIEQEDFQLISYKDGWEIIEKLDCQKHLDAPAFIVFNEKHRYIFYDDRMPISTRNDCLAHELAHIKLGHIINGVREAKPGSTDPVELEADAFAYQLLAPICVLRYLKINTLEKITQYTFLDGEQAEEVLKKLNEPEVGDKKLNKKLINKIINSREKRQKRITAIKAVAITLTAFLAIGLSTVFITDYVESTQQVYVTKSGTKYHKPDCHYLFESGKLKSGVMSKTLAECVKAGYTPCSYCFD